VVLLQGVNVGRNNSLPMAELRALLEGLGATNVRTYVQSGNAVVDTTRAEAPFQRALEAALAERMGRPIATTLRTAEALRQVVEGAPFGEVAAKANERVVVFLSRAPTAAELMPLEGDWGAERWQRAGREIFLFLPSGQGRSPLAAAVGRLVKAKMTVTMRNWNTVEKLLALAEDR
jgi:uncharacterized protein (DUF1697 family)